MRIEQLQAFLAVADTGSFQLAARRCGVTQSTISRQIQALETGLGAPLLRRSGTVQLTVSGDRLLPYARRICQAWQSATQEIQDLIGGKQRELCIAAIHSVCAYQLPPVLQKFIRDYPDVQLRITALGSDRSLKVLRDGLVDAAIVMNNRFLTGNADLVVEPLFEEPVSVLVGRSHPLADRAIATWADLGRYPHVVFKDGYGMQRLVQEQFDRHGVPLRVVLELNTLDAFRGVARQGKCVALLPESALQETRDDPTLQVLPLADDPIRRQVVLATTRDRLQIPPIARFRELVCQALQTPECRAAGAGSGSGGGAIAANAGVGCPEARGLPAAPPSG